MHSEMENLPDDIPQLKGMIVSLTEQYSKEKRRYEIENKLLREQVLLMKSKIFGRKTEKLPSGDEATQEILFDEPVVEGEEESSQEEPAIEVPAHTRRKSGRKPLPKDLPRVEIIHDLKEEEKVCGCGCTMVRIGQETSEQLDIVPARMQVIRHIRYKYACKSCEGVESEGPTVKIAPVPEQIIPKSIATPGLLAHIFTAKFVDAVPFYRQEKQFERLGVEMNRTSMSSWAMKVAHLCEPLMEMIRSEILTGPLINADETTVQVLEEPGRSNTSKSYMWLFRGGPPGEPALVYQYHPSRSGEVVKKYLDGYRGYVQTDGYTGYDFLVDITHEIPSHEIISGAWLLYTSYAFFKKGTVHLAVVDPGVGTERNIIAVKKQGHIFIGPDNGIFSFLYPADEVIEVTWCPEDPVSNTFHCRDIFAPVVVKVLDDPSCRDLGTALKNPVTIDVKRPMVVHIDRFGNVVPID